ncbi:MULTISPECIES: TetR/AcrR family transcriptional regulator [Streptomyces]|uniref:TetR/AcrR family transcriptional regulator n=2 Tax=Streptomyces TaxID=1883 RepID=A0ABV9J8I9_9ACTN
MSAAQGAVKRVPNRWGEGQRLRQEILDAAGRLLEETGRPEDISLRAIAREAGVTAPAIYKHFKDKAELMWTLLDGVYESMAETLRAARRSAPAEDAWAGLRAVVDAYCRFALDEPRRYELLFRIGPTLSSSPEPARHPMGRVLDAWCEATVSYLDEARGMDATSDPDGRPDARQAAKLLWSGLHGQFGLWWNVSDVSEASELDELRDSLMSSLFGRK